MNKGLADGKRGTGRVELGRMVSPDLLRKGQGIGSNGSERFGGRAGARTGRASRVGLRLVGGLALSLLVSWPTFGQVQINLGGVRNGSGPQASPEALLFEDPEVSNYLRNANDGIQRKDWKYAIDSLQRIIDRPGHSLVSVGGEVYESGRLHAQRRLAELPAEGLRVYRLLYDGQATAKLTGGRDQRDEEALHVVVRRFLLTSVGDNAADLLASWYLESGRGGEAAGLLRSVLEVYPDSDISKAILQGKLAVAMAIGGQHREAKAVVEQLPGKTNPDRKADLLAFIEAQSGIAHFDRSQNGWKMLGGTPSRLGRMDKVEPTFIETSPLRFDLPYETKRVDWDTALEFMDRHPAFPVFGVVTDGRQLLAKCQSRVVSLDLGSLEPLWMSEPLLKARADRSAQFPPVQVQQKQPPRSPLPIEDPGLQAALLDQVGGAISLIGDRAYVIMRDGWPELGGGTIRIGGRRVIVRRGVRQIVPVPSGLSASPSRLVALDARINGGTGPKGRELWSRGGRARQRANDPLAGAAFTSVPIGISGPIGIDENLFVTYRDQSSFNIGILSPTDGSLVRKIPLCDLIDPDVWSMRAVHPTLSDRVIYVPSNQGVLFAIDTSDFTVRWASRYPRANRQSTTSSITALMMREMVGQGWLDSPPVVSRDVVVLAPADSDELLAFDRLSGRIRWRLPREKHRILIGELGGIVFVGGPQVSGIDVISGTVQWGRRVGSPTGRAGLSGDRIYVPTTDGLVSLDVGSGQVIGRFDLPPDGAAFGNLLCWDGAMYSIDVASVRKYHDVQRSYAKALAAHADDPKNASAGIRLAWLELLQDRPKRAIEILDGVELRDTPDDRRRVEYLAHLKVEARLGLAAQEATAPAEAVMLLGDALETARSPADRTRTRLMLVERLADLGRLTEAVETCYALIGTPDGEDLVEMSDGWWCRANLMAPKKIEALMAKLKGAEKSNLENLFRKGLDEAVAQRSEERLRRIAEGAGATTMGQAAWLQLGRWALADRRFAAAEARLRESVRWAKADQLTAEGLAALAMLYSRPEVQLPRKTAEYLARLSSEFSDQSVTGEENLQPVAVESFIAGHRPAILPAEGSLDMPDRPTVEGTFDISWRLLSEGRLNWIDGGSWVGEDRVVMYQDPKRVVCRSATTGEILWETQLASLESPERMVGYTHGGVTRLASLSNLAEHVEAARAGHTLVLLTGGGLFGVDLISGKRLWAAESASESDSNPAEVIRALSVDESRYARLRSATMLEVGSAVDGRVLWRRQMVGRRLAAVKMSGKYALAVDRSFEMLYVFAQADGAFVDQCRFKQGRRPEGRMSLAVFDGICCGPDGRGIVAYDLATGNVLWRRKIDHDSRVVFRPNQELLGIGTEMGYVQLIDPKTGRIVFSGRIKEAPGGIVDGVLEGERLVLLGLREIGGVLENCLAGVSIAQNKVTWTRTDLGTGRVLWGDRPNYLRLASNGVPVVAHAATRRHVEGQSQRIGTLYFVGKETGQNLWGSALETHREGDTLTDELLIGRGRILVGTKRGMVALTSKGSAGDIR